MVVEDQNRGRTLQQLCREKKDHLYPSLSLGIDRVGELKDLGPASLKELVGPQAGPETIHLTPSALLNHASDEEGPNYGENLTSVSSSNLIYNPVPVGAPIKWGCHRITFGPILLFLYTVTNTN